MKKSVLSFLVLVLLNGPAFAGVVKIVAECGSAQPKPDQGYQVQVVSNFKSEVGIPENQQTEIIASVSAITVAGVLPVQSYVIHYEAADPGRLGSFASYYGEGFRLQFHGDRGSDVRNKIPATLTAKTSSGQQITEELLCVDTRPTHSPL